MTQLAASKLALWRAKPQVFVREVFGATPDPWQDDVLEAFPHNPRMAFCASKGVGKSTVLAWLVWNFMVTRPNPKIAVTSISGDNLRDGLWSELALWRDKAPLIKETFEWQKERIFNKHSPENWFVSARQWSKSADPQTIGNTLAGLHSDYIMFLLDESGGMPEAIMATAEAALSSCKEGHIIQAGNPTNLSGPLYNACTRDRSLWYVKEINSDPDDPKRSTRVSEKWAKEQIEKYGRDNPWVLVNVFGKFPPSSFNSLISVDEVKEATARRYKDTELLKFPRILGVDVARSGCFDDQTEILTNSGWKLFENLTGSEKILSVDLSTKISSWQPITHIHKYPSPGYLNFFESRTANFAITDNHRLPVRSSQKSHAYKLKEFKDLPEYYRLFEGNSWQGANPSHKTFISTRQMPNGGCHTKVWNFDYLDWAEFLGWFISEGCVYKDKHNRYRIVIAQRNKEKRKKIRDLLLRMGLKPQAKREAEEIWNNPLGEYLLQCGHLAPNKCIPADFKDSSSEALEVFLSSFCDGDGHKKKNGTRAYYTSSIKLRDDLQEVLAKLGRGASFHKQHAKGSIFTIEGRESYRRQDTWVIYERKSNTARIKNPLSNHSRDKYLKKSHSIKKPYDGFVYCVSTPLKTIYVRRQGVPMWSGNSDSSVLFPRQGLQAFQPIQIRNVDGTIGAEHTMRKWDEWDADGVFIDNTGGFGASWIDNLVRLGKDPIGIHFNESSLDKQYFNRRTEMAFKLVNWIKQGGAIPDINELSQALTSITYTFKGDKVILEPKEELKDRLGFSPDHMDALMLTFALPLDKKQREYSPKFTQHQFEYNPLSRDRILN